MALPVLHNHLLGGVNKLARGAFPRQSFIFLSFNVLETFLIRSLLLIPLSTPSASLCARFRISLGRFVVGRFDVAGRSDLPVRPHVQVVLERGGCLDRRHDGDWNCRDVAVLVADVPTDVAAEVGTIRTRRTADPLQLLCTSTNTSR